RRWQYAVLGELREVLRERYAEQLRFATSPARHDALQVAARDDRVELVAHHERREACAMDRQATYLRTAARARIQVQQLVDQVVGDSGDGKARHRAAQHSGRCTAAHTDPLRGWWETRARSRCGASMIRATCVNPPMSDHPADEASASPRATHARRRHCS